MLWAATVSFGQSSKEKDFLETFKKVATALSNRDSATPQPFYTFEQHVFYEN